MNPTTRRDPTIRFLRMALIAATLATPLLAERGDDADRVSKNGRTAGTIDGVEVVIEFGRPNAKGRELWGGLVPWGAVWRTGADEATTIEVESDVTIEGEPLAAGRYGLFTIPGESEWTVIFNRVADQWGAFGYDAAQDALRVTVEPGSGEHVESMDFAIEGDRVVLRWGEMRVAFTVAAAD